MEYIHPKERFSTHASSLVKPDDLLRYAAEYLQLADSSLKIAALSGGFMNANFWVRSILPKVVAMNKRYENQLGLFAAIDKATQDFIGWFILRPDKKTPDDTTNLEIGYRLKQRYWGQGFGTEASLALVEKARLQFGTRRIYAEAMPANFASIRIIEKIGLHFETACTETESDRTTVDLVLYSMVFS